MNAREVIALIESLHVIERERVAKYMLGEAMTHDLLAEVEDLYYAIDDDDAIVKACARIVKLALEIEHDLAGTDEYTEAAP